MKEGKKFEVMTKGNSVILSFYDGAVKHTESMPSKVSIAMGNQLIREGRKALKRRLLGEEQSKAQN